MALDRSAIAAQYLNVTANGKVTKMLVSKMSDDQIRAALGRPDNANALASGWKRNADGSIAKAAVPATPKPTITGGGVGATPNAAAPSGTAPTSTGAGGYMQVRQMQADGKYKIVWMAISKMTPAELAKAKVNGLNGGGAPADPKSNPAIPVSTIDPPATGGAAAGATQNVGSVSWIPPQVGLGGLNADPVTGKIDWSKVIAAANEVSAVDPQYAQDLSNNIWSAMQSMAAPQAEIQSLSTVDPTTGKTLYQSLFANAMQKYGQNQSSTLGGGAARGIGSSGMVNTTLANNTVANNQTISDADKQYGNTRIADLLKQMTSNLQSQDTNFTTSYYGALSRANQAIPPITAPTAG